MRTITKAELERHYQTRDGIIRSPGKFESEPIWAPYFWDVGMNGFADLDDAPDVGPVWAFILSAEDRAEFPSMFEADTYAVSLWESDAGFVYSAQLTREEYEKLAAGPDEPSEPDDEDWVTTDHVTFREHCSGKLVLKLRNGWDMWAHLKAEMDKRGFFPNVWFVSDHGNAHLMNPE